MAEKKVFWNPKLSSHFLDGRTPEGAISYVVKGGNLHEDLGALVELLRNDRMRWSVARVVCYPLEVEPDPSWGEGWYRARVQIQTEGYMPLQEAESRYLTTPQ